MSVNSGTGKYSLETFTVDHTSSDKISNAAKDFTKPERGVMSVLSIDNTDKSDENLYKCSMSNPFGSDSAFIQLVVQGTNINTNHMFRLFSLKILGRIGL